jgi:anti-anti-sigma factor
MQIGESRNGGVDVIAPVGRIDTTTVGALEARLTPLLAGAAPRVVIDFTGVEYISSAGLRVLLIAARRVQSARGRLVLCGMEGAVRQVFQLAGFVPLFTICDSRAAAVGEAGTA